MYRNSGRADADRVAAGRTRSATGSVTLAAENGSGLTGRIELNYVGDSTAVSLAVVPEIVALRKAHLRTLWHEADHPASTLNAPMIDPDVVTQADLMRPFADNPAHTLWVERVQMFEEKRVEVAAANSVTNMADDREILDTTPSIGAWDAIAANLASADAAAVESGSQALMLVSPVSHAGYIPLPVGAPEA